MTPIDQLPAAPIDPLAAEQQQAQAAEQQRNLYWAAKQAGDVVAELNNKERAYFEVAQRRGFTAISKVSFAQYHGLSADGGSGWETQTVNLEGAQGELLRFRVNEFRSFMKQLIQMAIGNRPAFEASATNTDYDSIGQAETADAIVDYVYDNTFGERKERKVVEYGMLYALGFTWVSWDANSGEEVMADQPAMRKLADGSAQPLLGPDNKPLTEKVKTGKRTGKLVMKAIPWWRQFCEPKVDEADEHLWRCVRERRSKYEVAATVPEGLREQILGLDTRDEYGIEQLFGFQDDQYDSSEITVKHFYHAPSPAMTGSVTAAGEEASAGRYIVYAGNIVLRDIPLPYPVIPLIDFCPAEYIGTSWGYADAWDLIAVNQMLDQVISDCASNIATFGRQSIWAQDGLHLNAEDIANGMKILTSPAGSEPPKPIVFAAVPEASKWFVETLRKFFQSLSGLNSVTRGDPDHNITSGQMAALFHSIAIEFMSGPQAAVDHHRERVANLIVDILKQYAEHPMIMQIAGKDERAYADTFVRDDLYGISGVKVKTSNPMMRTTAGKMQIGDKILEYAKTMPPGTVVSDPSQIIEVYTSGQIKPLYDSPRKRRMRIKAENEALQEGPAVQDVTPPPLAPLPNGLQPPPKPPYKTVPETPVLWFDNHRQHIAEHEALLSSREALNNQPMRDAVLAHIDDHYRVWEETDPRKLAARGLPPYPAPMLPPAPPPANDNGRPMPKDKQGPPEAMEPTDQPKQMETGPAGTKLPKPAQSPMPGGVKGAA